MTPIITSVRNPAVKETVQLHRKKHRQESGLVLVEGPHCLEEAIKAGLGWEAIYLRDDVDFPMSFPIEPVLVTGTVMAKMATTESPPPVIGVARYEMQASGSFSDQDTGCVLGLFQLQDPGNMGTLIRTACAFGVTAMATIGLCADPTNPKVIRSASGMVFRMPWYSFDTLHDFKAAAESYERLSIWAADAHSGHQFNAVDYGQKTMLILGSEAHGLPQDIFTFVQPVHIPMDPQVESLNVAMAGAIILSQIWLQKHPA